MTGLPLFTRGERDVVAYRHGQAVDGTTFLAEAHSLAGRLPARAYVVNLCRDRYHFMVAFAGALIAGQTNLLPPNRLDATVHELLAIYPGAYVLSDENQDRSGWPLAVDVRDGGRGGNAAVPIIEADHRAAIVFTSGSTGASKAIEKPWRTFYESTRINASEMGFSGGDPMSVVATVPAQHMYGLETSVLMPLLAPVAVSNERPLMPADVAAALHAVPRPRVLVSTPAHLRALGDLDLALPEFQAVWSATAPLDPALAGEIEERRGVRVKEIYGCSEAGSLARREPVREVEWRLFSGFDLASTADGIGTRVSAPHLPQSYPLQDHLEHLAPGRFRLAGRSEDLVNIAGKRASLAALNQALMRVPGVEDGVIFDPVKAKGEGVSRLAALVVAPHTSAEQIRQALRAEIDAPFVPRPIRFVDALPRSDTGKLTREALLALYQQAGGPQEGRE